MSMPTRWFGVYERNPGHWDIYGDRENEGRMFRIRGVPGDVIIFDERNGRENPPPKKFKTVGAAMTVITEELMEQKYVYENKTD